MRVPGACVSIERRNPRFGSAGGSDVESDSSSERENLPDQVEPGVTYRDAEVRWRAESRIVEPDREPPPRRREMMAGIKEKALKTVGGAAVRRAQGDRPGALKAFAGADSRGRGGRRPRVQAVAAMSDAPAMLRREQTT